MFETLDRDIFSIIFYSYLAKPQNSKAKTAGSGYHSSLIKNNKVFIRFPEWVRRICKFSKQVSKTIEEYYLVSQKMISSAYRANRDSIRPWV